MRAVVAARESLRLPLGPRYAEGKSPARGLAAAVLVAAAVATAAAPWAPHVRAASALALIGLAAAAYHARDRRRRWPLGWLVVDGDGVHRVDDAKRATLADFGAPFGVTVFADPERRRFLFAFTSPRQARYLSAQVEDADGDASLVASVVDRAVTAAESDLRAGDDAALSIPNAGRLLAEVSRRSPAALDRLYLSDATGDAVVLDRAELRVGTRRIDLSAPLEWRASVFQERGVHTTSVSQATWVRQADVEVVLVAPVPAEGGWLRGVDLPASHRRRSASTLSEETRAAVVRDLRLMQASAGEPPPRELRRAIDRVFMLPLRRALDRAPRLVRAGGQGPRPSRPEGFA